MDERDKLKLLTSQMHLEPAEDSGCPQIVTRHKPDIHINQAITPRGKPISLLKTLLTSACERNCFYCPFRAGRDFRRATFKPDEMARLFNTLHQAGVAEGIFLSSGIVNGGLSTQDKLIATAELLRNQYKFSGYLHLKIMPGAEKAQVERAMQLADRISINLEAPNTQKLQQLAPRKQFLEELLEPLRWADEIRRTQPGDKGWKGYWPSTVTQFVVGAVGESDLELLSTTDFLYNQLHLKRAYFSPFNPIPDTPLQDLQATPIIRERRLYASSFLIRDYGFDLEELAFDPTGNLPLHIDPKEAWARANLSERPVELNRASRQELLRVPGIGLKSAAALLEARRLNKLQDLSQLTKIGVSVTRAAPFILLNGRRPAHQSSFFAELSLQTG